MKVLTKQDLEDILYGAAILGTGGGGELAEGFGYIDEAMSQGKTFKMVSLQDTPDAALECARLLGAISSLSEDEELQRQECGDP